MLPAGCLIATNYVSSNVPLAVCLIVAGVGFSGVSCVAFCVNPLDLAPQYAGQNRRNTYDYPFDNLYSHSNV